MHYNTPIITQRENENMAKLNIVAKGLVKGVKGTISSQYKTSDGRTWTNANQANRYQLFINRTAAVKAVLRDSGLLAYKSNANILSVGPLAANIVSGDFLAKLTAAANGRTPRTRKLAA